MSLIVGKRPGKLENVLNHLGLSTIVGSIPGGDGRVPGASEMSKERQEGNSGLRRTVVPPGGRQRDHNCGSVIRMAAA